MHIFRVLIANILGVWAADKLVAGFNVPDGILNYIVAGSILGFLTLFLKPILRLLTGPVIVLTLGLFSLVINGFIIWLAGYFTDTVSVVLWTPLIWATLIITVLNVLAHGKD